MEVLASRDTWWMTQVEAALASQGIQGRWLSPWLSGARGASLLDVPVSEIERTSEILSEQLAEELKKRAQRRPPEKWVPLLLQPAFAAALCMATLFVLFYLFTGGSEHAGVLFRRGALITSRFFAGEGWRLVTAATLHADAPHVAGNAGFLLVLGWASNERFGTGVTCALWLLTAVLGFVASLWWGEAGMTVGASGGLFGLLGASGGHAWRSIGKVEFPRRERLRAFGSAVALLAFTAFSPDSNIPAHVGGFASGFVLGAILPVSRALGAVVQLGCGLGAIVLVTSAWLAAF
jgi:rhomboid protease GluP